MAKCYSKICKHCKSQSTKKDGKRKGRQSYRCNDCGYVRISQSRKKTQDRSRLYEDYAQHKQTYNELAVAYDVGIRTIQTYLDSRIPKPTAYIQPGEVILLIDTTYFGDFGVIVFKDCHTKDILHHEIVKYETNAGYVRGITYLQEQGRIIKAIVSDGKKGLLGGFGAIPTQMCHFHQQQIIRRYITKKPILEANKGLKSIVDRLHRTDKQSFTRELERRYNKHEKFIKEQGISNEGRKYYLHRRTRSAYFSLKRNLKYLFVYQDYDGIIDIPNTTNGLEAVFSHLKYKVNLHRGLRNDRKLKLILYLDR